MRGEINSNQYQISFRLKISLRCLASSLLLFTWIEVKWNSERYGFHISHFERNKISNWHEIFMGTEFTRKEMNKRRLVLNLCLMRMCVWNSLRVWTANRSFWQKWNLISCDKISCKQYPKWIAYACPSECRVVLKCSRNETSCEQNLFSRRFGISNPYEFISPLMPRYSEWKAWYLCSRILKLLMVMEELKRNFDLTPLK